MSPLLTPKGNMENTRARPEFRCFHLENPRQNTKLQGRRSQGRFEMGYGRGGEVDSTTKGMMTCNTQFQKGEHGTQHVHTHNNHVIP